MDAVYPATASALARGRRLRRAEPRLRHRTMPVTFAEIKEVDEESEEASAREERRRRPDVLEDERLSRQFCEFRRRRERRAALRERDTDHELPPAAGVGAGAGAGAGMARAGSEPAALHRGREPAPAARDT